MFPHKSNLHGRNKYPNPPSHLCLLICLSISVSAAGPWQPGTGLDDIIWVIERVYAFCKNMPAMYIEGLETIFGERSAKVHFQSTITNSQMHPHIGGRTFK
ncbi:Hypothetical predicted protein [Podarcis lilfordi]|uniref:Uncharacterized protein n=1 Tax=Podarcis lilfordi TaxID=74358 RepID=A0AA35KYN0_9SAUR|nr:Hypothetical predicted protein [Podarcis lilfordi]